MESRISTYGLLILGTMIFSRYLISTNENSNDFQLGTVDVTLNENLKEDTYLLALSYQKEFNLESKLIAAILPDFNRKYIPTNTISTQSNINSNEELIVINEELNNTNVGEDLNEGVLSMDQGSSSVVLMMPVAPQEKIIQKGSRGNFPLDGGNTISNTMNKLFPIKTEE